MLQRMNPEAKGLVHNTVKYCMIWAIVIPKVSRVRIHNGQNKSLGILVRMHLHI